MMHITADKLNSNTNTLALETFITMELFPNWRLRKKALTTQIIEQDLFRTQLLIKRVRISRIRQYRPKTIWSEGRGQR